MTTLTQQFILCSLLSLSSVAALAIDTANTTNDNSKTSKSISYKSNSNLDADAKLKMLKEAPIDINNLTIQNSLASKASTAERHIADDYSLYNATTDLISDMDYDGFYHRFAVTLDVDTLFDHATVYADFYLSYEGGPWIYYASSNHYDIHSDSALDAFTIETELADGYPTGYYDMRIKVYDSNSDEYLLTYDYSDDGSLSYIPLEDSYRDEGYNDSTIETEIIVTHGAGSINLLSLLFLSILLAIRQMQIIFPHTNFLSKTKVS